MGRLRLGITVATVASDYYYSIYLIIAHTSFSINVLSNIMIQFFDVKTCVQKLLLLVVKYIVTHGVAYPLSEYFISSRSLDCSESSCEYLKRCSHPILHGSYDKTRDSLVDLSVAAVAKSMILLSIKFLRWLLNKIRYEHLWNEIMRICENGSCHR